MGVRGFRQAISMLEGLEDAVGDEVAGALYEEGQEIMTDSKKNFVPVATGVLRSSGFVRLPENRPSGWSVTLGFGGPAGTGNHAGDSNAEKVGYAAVQHERLDYNHTVGEAKYLEKPALMAAADMEGRMADRIRARLDL